MRTDLKIGVILGIVVVVAAIILITRRADEGQGLAPPQTTQEKPLSTEPAPKILEATEAAPPSPETTLPKVLLPSTETAPADGVIPEKPAEPLVVTPPPAEPAPPKDQYHVVAKGDSLSHIAERYYGHQRFWKVIYQANRNIIKDPERLQVGWKLRIPSPQEVAEKENTQQ